jgi:excisionase family DNA binding protein
MASVEQRGFALLRETRVRAAEGEPRKEPGDWISVLLIELPSRLRNRFAEEGVDLATVATEIEQVIDRESRLAHLLDSLGVQADIEDLHVLLEEALGGLRERGGAQDPTAHFTEAELAELERDGFDLRPLPSAEVDPAVRTAVRSAELTATALSVQEAASLLGVDESRIRQRLSEGSLYGIKVGRSWRLPRFQFTSSGLIPGIDVVLRRLPPNLHPVAVWRWLTTASPDLVLDDEARSPTDWLLTGGDPEAVASLGSEL